MKQTKSVLWNEAILSPDCKVCDNIDLDTIYLDFCSYYHMRFGKLPKILRKIEGESNDSTKGKITKNKSSENSTKPSDDCQKKLKNEKDSSLDDLALTNSPASNTGESDKIWKKIEINSLLNIHRKNVDLIEKFPGEMQDLACIIERFARDFI